MAYLAYRWLSHYCCWCLDDKASLIFHNNHRYPEIWQDLLTDPCSNPVQHCQNDGYDHNGHCCDAVNWVIQLCGCCTNKWVTCFDCVTVDSFANPVEPTQIGSGVAADFTMLSYLSLTLFLLLIVYLCHPAVMNDNSRDDYDGPHYWCEYLVWCYDWHWHSY